MSTRHTPDDPSTAAPIPPVAPIPVDQTETVNTVPEDASATMLRRIVMLLEDRPTHAPPAPASSDTAAASALISLASSPATQVSLPPVPTHVAPPRAEYQTDPPTNPSSHLAPSRLFDLPPPPPSAPSVTKTSYTCPSFHTARASAALDDTATIATCASRSTSHGVMKIRNLEIKPFSGKDID